MLSICSVAQPRTDWEIHSLKGKVKYLKEVSDEVIQETFFNEQGYIDSITTMYKEVRNSEALIRDKDGWLLSRRYYRDTTLIAVFSYDYNEDHTEATQTDTLIGSSAKLKFNEFGQEVYRFVQLGAEGTDTNTREIFITHDSTGHVLTSKTIKTFYGIESSTTNTYTYNPKGWVLFWEFKNEDEFSHTILEYKYFNYNIDNNGNWKFRERQREGDALALSIIRRFKFYE